MAGVGFALRKIVNNDDLTSSLQGYTLAALITSGPWLFTIVALAGINWLAQHWLQVSEITVFRIIVIYNFAFSLVISGPIIMTATRYLADCIYEKKLDSIPSALLMTLGLVYLTSLVFIVPFYGFVVELTPTQRVAAILNYLLVSGIWVVAIALSALKYYTTYSVFFGLGMLGAFAAAPYLGSQYGAAGMLFGFNIGMMIIMFAVVARVFVEFPYHLVWPKKYFAYFRIYGELVVAGFVLNAAAWLDKWVMWFSDDRAVAAGAMIFHPDYDVAMFLAYLTIVPGLAYFVVSMETGFFERHTAYQRTIENNGSYESIQRAQSSLITQTADALKSVLFLQLVIAGIAVYLAPQIVPLLGGKFVQVGMFRLGVLGAFFHVMFLFITIVLAYFDLRRLNVQLFTLFLVLNGLLSYLSMSMGREYYGYGYFAAALLTFLVAYGALRHVLRSLPYYTFVKNNAAI